MISLLPDIVTSPILRADLESKTKNIVLGKLKMLINWNKTLILGLWQLIHSLFYYLSRIVEYDSERLGFDKNRS